jgi:tRNA pseudouridine55 synthase
VDGLLVIDKPQGLSSNDVVQRAKHLFKARKVGHTGSLDPLATGVLPLCFGEATKFSQFLLASDKTYRARVKLGVRTDSGDADGKIVATRPVGVLDREAIERALDEFRGEIDQVPSMFSAVKHQGQPLYKLARRGIEVERKARAITVYRNELVAFDGDELTLEIRCSKGTYVRTIVEELGELLGCGAHVCALRRLAAGPFSEADLVTFETLESALADGGFHALDGFLKPISSAVRHWPAVKLSDATSYYVRQGQPVLVPHAPTAGWVQIFEADASNHPGAFLGVGEILDDGRVAPRRLVLVQQG